MKKAFIGSRLRQLRRELGITQAAMAESLGISAAYVNMLEKNQRSLSVPVLMALSAQFGIDWFEEPVIPEQLGAYRAVRAGQPIAVAGGETWHGRFGFREPLETRCIDIAQPDLCGTGGFTEMRRIADLAALHGVRLVPHVWGTVVQIAASLQFMAALLPDPPRREPIEPILEFDRTPNPFRQAIARTPIEHENGVVRIPDGPGLGIEIDRDVLAEFALKAD